jgi:Spy/CpxP family protein refolding chaperone
MKSKLAIIGILAVSIAAAQRGGGGGGRGGRGGGGGEGMPAFQAAKNHLELITDELKLSKEQKKEVKALMDEAQKEAMPLKDQLVKSRTQLANAIESGKQDDIDKDIQSHSMLEAEMAAVEMKAFAAIYKILDADQRSKSRAVFVMMPGIFKAKNWVDAE